MFFQRSSIFSDCRFISINFFTIVFYSLCSKLQALRQVNDALFIGINIFTVGVQSFSQTCYAFACLVGFIGDCVNFRSSIHCFIGGIFGFFYFAVNVGRKFGYFVFGGFGSGFGICCVLLQSIHTGVYCGYVFADCVKLVGNVFTHIGD